jgi:DNA modification methylase
VGKAAVKLGRRFVLIEQNPAYVAVMREEAKEWLGEQANDVVMMNSQPMEVCGSLF